MKSTDCKFDIFGQKKMNNNIILKIKERSGISERKKEIGIMMALGARSRDIALCFIAESAIISGIGGIAGVAFGVLLSFSMTRLMKMPTMISINTIIIIIFVAVLCGIVFSLIPAYRASRLNPVETLHE